MRCYSTNYQCTKHKEMKITLITSDFKGAIFSSAINCPLANALNRLFPEQSHIREATVGYSLSRIGFEMYQINEPWEFTLQAKQAIQKANKGEEIENFELELKLT